jgi:2-polyprenyl-3-methyl-5-hydroxy-6-metoxy-1,4-benzoquinol methylase
MCAAREGNRQEKLDRAAKMKWFHALDFGDCQSSGRFPEGTPQNRTLYGVMDLLKDVDVAGKQCLDVGTAHGICAFNMASRGGIVTATDIFESASPPFLLARDLLNLEVDYRAGTSFDNILSVLGEHRYDVMVCAGVLYHMLNPFDSILKARKLLKPKGIFVLETAYDPSVKGATIDFNAVSGRLKEVYTYWIPSESAVLGMMRFAGFDVMSVRTIQKPDRIAVIAENVSILEVRDRTDMMIRLHETSVQDPSFPAALPKIEPANVKYTGPRDRVALDWSVYKPDFYPHPMAPKRVLGKTTWRATARNF